MVLEVTLTPIHNKERYFANSSYEQASRGLDHDQGLLVKYISTNLVSNRRLINQSVRLYLFTHKWGRTTCDKIDTMGDGGVGGVQKSIRKYLIYNGLYQR